MFNLYELYYQMCLIWWKLLFTQGDEIKALRNCRNVDRERLEQVIKKMQEEGRL